MVDITMCTQKLCPNATHCYRVQAKPSEWQSIMAFYYSVGVNGVVCSGYIPLYRMTESDSTVPNNQGEPLTITDTETKI